MQEFRDGRSYVYFIGADVGLIKIGQTSAPLCRLSAFNLGSPIELRFLALIVGGAKEERKYQARFADLRVRGEWFERSPEILRFIKRTRSRQICAARGSSAPLKHFLDGAEVA